MNKKTWLGHKKKKCLGVLLRYLLLIVLALFVVVPILWMLSTAFKSEAQTYSPTPIWIPNPISFDSFKKFWKLYNFGKMTLNS
ncbi:ABC transporter permease, partial [Lachnotalea glycerini]